MRPILFHIGSFAVPAYGAAVIGAIWLAIGISQWLRRVPHRPSLPWVPACDLGLGSLCVGLVGAHLLHLAVHPEEWSALALVRIWEGRAYLGGFLLGLAYAVIWTRRRGLAAWAVLDLMAVVVPAAQALGRVGCFLAGCCHGRPSDAWWAVALDSPYVDAELRGVPLHPAQLYEAAGLLVLFASLRLVWTRGRRPLVPSALFLSGTALVRFVVEYFRGDRARGVVLGGALSPSQAIAAALFAASLVLWWSAARAPVTPGRQAAPAL